MSASAGRIAAPSRERLVALASCAVMVAVLTVLSLVAIPLPISPVPVTLQTLGVFLAGGLLGPGWGALAVVAYVVVGVAGVPIFAGGEAGLGVILGPKGGYVLGFLCAAILVGLGARAAGSDRRGARGVMLLIIGLVTGTAAVYVCGAGWLMLVTGMETRQAVLVGVLPFLPGDVLKIAAAAVVIPGVQRARRARRS